jgi:hypothetical protein
MELSTVNLNVPRGVLPVVVTVAVVAAVDSTQGGTGLMLTVGPLATTGNTFPDTPMHANPPHENKLPTCIATGALPEAPRTT